MSTQNTPPTVSLELTVAESQALAYQRELQTAHDTVAARLAQEILGLVGAQCVLEFLPEQGNEEGDDADGFAPARLILFEHLVPHYLTAIVAKVQALQEKGEIPSNLSIAITQKALQDLDLGPDLPTWVVANDQNATYWRNNIEPNTIKLCAISSGENEDTLSNITDRINSESLKQHLADKAVLVDVLTDLQQALPELMGTMSPTEQAHLKDVPRVLGEFLTDPLHDDLATTLSALNDTLSVKPSDVSTYIANVLLALASGARNLRTALGEALPTFQIPRQGELFLTKSKTPKPYTKLQAKRFVSGILNTRPTLFNYAVAAGQPLESFKLNKLKENLSPLLSATTVVEGSKEEVPLLAEWESGLLKEFVAPRSKREVLFAQLCTIEWTGKLELFFNPEPKDEQKKSLYERTMAMFQDNLTNEAKLTTQEETTIELVKQDVKALTRDNRNELNELYQSRRAIFDQEPSISKEWEKYIYYEDNYAEPNFLLSLSKAVLNLARSGDDSDELLERLTITLDGTAQKILEKNAAVMSYFSLRYGAFLRGLTERLGGRLVVDYAGSNTTSKKAEPQDESDLNPLFNYQKFFAARAKNKKQSPKSTKERDLTLVLVLTPTYRKKEGDTLEQGKPFKLSWQLHPSRVSFLFSADLEALCSGPILRCGLFEHDEFTAQGTRQDLSLYNNTTLLFPEKTEPTFFNANDSADCDLSARWQAKMERLEQQLDDPNLTAPLKECFAQFEQQYRDCLQQLKDCTLQPSACHQLSHIYSALQYELLQSPINQLQQGTSAATATLKELLALILQVGMAYRKSASAQDLSYAIATPFTVEALRSHACKLERTQELICDILEKPISINDRAVFLSSLEQDLNYYDAPELCLNSFIPSSSQSSINSLGQPDASARSSELIATQALGGYTLYVAQSKLRSDLGENLARPVNLKGRGRPKKALPTNITNGTLGGGGCSGIGGANASSNSSELTLEALTAQIGAYLKHHPYPLSQCTLILSHCPVSGFALELYRTLQQEQREHWSGTHLNLVILCPDTNQAQDVFALFESERFALKQSLEGPEFVKNVSVTILLEDNGPGSSKRFGTLNDYLERMSLQQNAVSAPSYGNTYTTNGAHDSTSNDRFAQIGLMVHAFDALSDFKFTQAYEVPVVTDEVHYQPSLINMVDATPTQALGRFVVSPVLPLSKIVLLHSIFYLKSGIHQDFTAAKSQLQQALNEQQASLTQNGQAASALGLTEPSAHTITVPTPLYERTIADEYRSPESARLTKAITQIHKSCDTVFYLDDLLDRKQLKNKGIRVLYYQKLPHNSLNFIIATQVNVEAKTRQFLQKLVADTNLSPEDQANCLKQVAEASLNISGRLLMHAQLRRQHAYELMGVVLTGFMAQSMMDLIAQHYQAQGQTYRSLIYLDDYKSIFQAVGSQRQKRLADLLGIQLIKHEVNGEPHYLLNLVVMESKFLECTSTDAANKSLKQTRETTELLHRAFKLYATRHSLDRKQWLARIADMLVDNSDQLSPLSAEQNLGSDEFSRVQQLIRNGQVDILLKGCSLVFARSSGADEGESLNLTPPLCEANIDPKLDKSSPNQGFPLVQAKFTGAGVTTVLTTFHQHQGKGNYQALEDIATKCHDDTIKHYCIKDDPTFLLQAQQPNVTQPEVKVHPEPAPADHTVAPTTTEEPAPVATTTTAETVTKDDTKDTFQLDHEILGRDSGLGLEPILGGQTAPLIHDEFTQQTKTEPPQVQPPVTPEHHTPVTPVPPIVTPPQPEPPQVQPPVTSERHPPVTPEPPVEPPVMPPQPPVEPPVVTPPQPESEVLAPERSEWLATVPRRAYSSWRPDVATLLPCSVRDDKADQRQLARKIENIDEAFREFGVDAKVDYPVPGPIITSYILKLGYGEASKAIERIVNELPRKLGVPSVRFIATNVILEVPNDHRANITLGDVLSSAEFKQTKATLPLALGLAPDGTPIVRDLVDGGPHLLVAGTTGSGKSVGLNSLLLSMIARLSPQELRLIIIDPKREFQAYDALPHMLAPAIKDVTAGSITCLRWCIDEMEHRYDLFEDIGKPNLVEYNQYIISELQQGRRNRNYFAEEAQEYLEPLPRIVVLIDEFSDLMAQARASGRTKGSEFEALIARIVQKSRAAGIHLILATQSPRANVVTGLIKSNLPARIAFKVSDNRESMIVLDETGAEDLLGKGDMLYHLISEPTSRAHGAYATGNDINALVSAWHKRYGDPEYLTELTQKLGLSPATPENLDELQAKAVSIAQEFKAQGSTVTERDLRHRLGLNSLTAQKVMTKLKEQGLL